MSTQMTLSLQDVIQRVEAEAEDQPLSRLQTASALVKELADIGDAALGYFVDQARHAGHSWSEIGEALGVSKQAAQQKQTVRQSLGLNPQTFARFTERARAVVAASEPIARNLGHGYVGTEHLLLALYQQPEGVAAQILVESGLPADEAEAAVARRIGAGSVVPEGKLPFTPRAIAVYNGALASALEMGHNYIGTEHLLLGLARGSGVAADVLAEFGLSEENLAQKVITKLSGYLEVRGVAGPGEKPSPTRGPVIRSTATSKQGRAPVSG
jgi:Clp amino terminal domain, pathogenicity island component